ncbi:MAG: glycosyltransferase family A protein [Solirubrobacteraceae bacterium]
MNATGASVVITSYNYARFLRETIESALAQTHPGTEVIVVDDGSEDDSPAIIASFDGRVRSRVQTNRGQGGAFNAGFALSEGDVVLFLDSDDVLLPSAVARAVDAARDRRVSQVHWRMPDIDASGEQTGGMTPESPLADGDMLGQLVSDGPLQWSSPPTSGSAWSRTYLRQVLPMPEAEFRVNADAYLTGLAPLYGELRALEEPQSLYRRHGENHGALGFDGGLRVDAEVWAGMGVIAAAHAARLGVEVDPERWRERGWAFRLARAVEELDSVVGRDAPFVLIDGCELALERSSGRPVIPFLERDGEYWGRPEDDAHAIEELDRLRSAGARFVVVAWTAFWWSEAYPAFFDHLRERFRCRLDNERLLILELQPG